MRAPLNTAPAMGRLRALSVLTLVVAVAAPAGAQDRTQDRRSPNAVDAADRAAITSCLREASESPRSCIGAVAVSCAARGGPGERGDAGVSCSRREEAVWRERLDFAATLLAGQIEAGPRSRLVALQRTWEGYVAQKCNLAGDLQPPAQGAAMQAGCSLREVAIRSVELERLARTARSRAGNTPPRPRLER